MPFYLNVHLKYLNIFLEKCLSSFEIKLYLTVFFEDYFLVFFDYYFL